MESSGDLAEIDSFIAAIRTTFEIDDEVTADSPLLASGLIDSFDVVVLLDVIEARYGVTIPVEEVEGETFNTPRQIMARIDEGRSR